jgi:hypothetical protein
VVSKGLAGEEMEVVVNSDLVRRTVDSVGLVTQIRRLPRAVDRAIDLANGRALVAVAVVEGAALVTDIGMRELVDLTAREARAIELCPLGEPRYRVIVDTFAGLVANTVARLDR